MATLTRIDIRIDERRKQVISKAAQLAGQNVSQYILGLVLPDAQLRVMEESRLRLPEKDWRHFCQRLDEPVRDLPELRELLQRPGRFQDA